MVWFDIFILIVIIYCLISGYKSGLVKQLTSLVGLITAAILTGQIATLIYPYIKGFADLPDYITEPLSYLIVFILIILAFYFLGVMLDTIVKTIKMGTLNKLAGVVFCLTKWLFVISITVNIISKIDNNNQLISKEIENESYSYKYVKDIAPKIIPYLRFANNTIQNAT